MDRETMRDPRGHQEPPYLRIAAGIRARIRSGELGAGERAPSTRQIIAEWGVAMATATKALAELRREGLVEAVPGSGTVVRPGRAAAQPRRGAHPRPEASAAAPEGPEGRDPHGPQDARQRANRERAAAAAVAIADDAGLAALTMRGVAAELGIGVMTLYHYVSGKEELVGLMLDSVFGEDPPAAVPASDWRAALRELARTQWRIFALHPWAAQSAPMSRPLLAPNAVAHTEQALRALDGHGLPAGLMLDCVMTLTAYVQGMAANRATERGSGTTKEQWLRSNHRELDLLLASGRYPVLARITAEHGDLADVDAMFEFGLERQLDGIAAVVAAPLH